MLKPSQIEAHLRTILPTLWHRLSSDRQENAEPWETAIADPTLGSLRLTGLASHATGSDTLLIVVHGLGGSACSPYAEKAALAARSRGWSCLRLNLRGADGLGEDIYHAGLSDDIVALIADRSLAHYRRVLLLGYSLGGHLCLHAATRKLDQRVRRIAAICPPLDLQACQRHIDDPRRVLYRRYILRSLIAMFRQVASRRRWASAVAGVERIRSLQAWDAAVVVPRFGFADVASYYAKASVFSRLDRLKVPTLIAASWADPIIPAASIERGAGHGNDLLHLRWFTRGGHVLQRADPLTLPAIMPRQVSSLDSIG